MTTTTTSKDSAAPSTLSSGAEREVDKTTGEFRRKPSLYRHWIGKKLKTTKNDVSELDDSSGTYYFPPEGDGRYHLFVSYACPWSTRTLLTLNLKGITNDIVGRSIAHPNYQPLVTTANEKDGEEDKDTAGLKGWVFDSFAGYPNNATNHRTLRDVYLHSDADYSGKWTVPCLYDTKTGKIVNNESSDIMTIFNQDHFHPFIAAATTKIKTESIPSAVNNTNIMNLRPSHLIDEIQRLEEWLYPINNGVYQCGFARSQEAYDKAAVLCQERLDACEELLQTRPYLAGNVFTESDLRLFATLVRWDSIYFVHFKCCFRRIADYPKLSNYVAQIYQLPEIQKEIPFDYIRQHYYQDHRSCNPHGIVPLGPVVTFLDAPHDREDIVFA